ncbi:MAG TPA: 3'(2'),5'-bisphosphate nucleotidase CysQ [Acidimicrobiales bacterium]|nr:3'(2'),5'-bisphosphate nucleotidase CysQ [Acidimicrobiales bacterium]
MLVDLRRSLAGTDPGRLGAEGDRRSHALITGLLASARPDDPVLSEEGVDNGRRLASQRVWIVDPLDGTREYGEGDRVDWAVHVALWSDGDLVAGAVALPAVAHLSGLLRDGPPHERVDRARFTWATARDHGGAEDAAPPPTGRLVVSRTRPPSFAAEVGRESGLEVVPLGSAGAKIMAVVRGEADAYVHAGGQFEWDSAAPVAVARWHGLHTSRIDGSPLTYNRPDPSLPDIVVCRPELAEPLLAAVAQAMRGS